MKMPFDSAWKLRFCWAGACLDASVPLACGASLPGEAEALNLAEIRGHLSWRDGVRRNSDDVFFGLVGGCVEGEGRLAGKNADFALLRHKLPREDVRYGSVECDANSRMVLHGLEALCGVGVRVSAVGGRFDRLASPTGRLADLCTANVRHGTGIYVFGRRTIL